METEIRKRANGPDIQQEWRTTGGLSSAQSGNQGEGRDHGDDQEEHGKTTLQERSDHLEQESNRQRTMEGIDGGLHPSVDGQSLHEGEGRRTQQQQQTMRCFKINLSAFNPSHGQALLNSLLCAYHHHLLCSQYRCFFIIIDIIVSFLYCVDSLQSADGEIHVTRRPVAEYDNTTKRYHVVLMCGTLTYPTHPEFDAEWLVSVSSCIH